MIPEGNPQQCVHTKVSSQAVQAISLGLECESPDRTRRHKARHAPGEKHDKNTVDMIEQESHRSHFGSRYKLGCCACASLFLQSMAPCSCNTVYTPRIVRGGPPARRARAKRFTLLGLHRGVLQTVCTSRIVRGGPPQRRARAKRFTLLGLYRGVLHGAVLAPIILHFSDCTGGPSTASVLRARGHEHILHHK